MTRIPRHSSRFVSGVGFSKGWAEFALKKPPPLVPSCLMAICDAAGPVAIAWVVTAAVLPSADAAIGCSNVAAVGALQFCTTPCDTNTRAKMNDAGSNIQTVERQRSTHALPIVAARSRTKPRANATSTAMPVAAERKFCTPSPSAWVKWLMVLSPPYACQFVLVAKLMAVLSARCQVTAVIPAGLPGNTPCRSCRANTTSKPSTLKKRIASAYVRHPISASAITPQLRRHTDSQRFSGRPASKTLAIPRPISGADTSKMPKNRPSCTQPEGSSNRLIGTTPASQSPPPGKATARRLPPRSP